MNIMHVLVVLCLSGPACPPAVEATVWQDERACEAARSWIADIYAQHDLLIASRCLPRWSGK